MQSGPAGAGVPAMIVGALLLAGCVPGEDALPTVAPTRNLDAVASLPDNVWTTRLVGNGVEAVVSNGNGHIALSCRTASGDAVTVMHFAPRSGRPASGEAVLEVVAAGAPVRAVVPFREAEWLAGSAVASTDNGLAPIVAALSTGGGDLTLRPGTGPALRFTRNGAAEALRTALSPRGCLQTG